MATKTIRQRVIIAAPPLRVYEALTKARLTAAFTGSPATSSTRVGGRFTAWDGYILGVHRELLPGKRIVQDWSTTEWPEGDPPSRLELTLRRVEGGTELRMVHSNVPATQAAGYRQGWIDYYWNPLKAYLGSAQAAPSRAARGRRGRTS